MTRLFMVLRVFVGMKGCCVVGVEFPSGYRGELQLDKYAPWDVSPRRQLQSVSSLERAPLNVWYLPSQGVEFQ